MKRFFASILITLGLLLLAEAEIAAAQSWCPKGQHVLVKNWNMYVRAWGCTEEPVSAFG